MLLLPPLPPRPNQGLVPECQPHAAAKEGRQPSAPEASNFHASAQTKAPQESADSTVTAGGVRAERSAPHARPHVSEMSLQMPQRSGAGPGLGSQRPSLAVDGV